MIDWLDGGMITLAMFCLNFFHPGYLLGKRHVWLAVRHEGALSEKEKQQILLEEEEDPPMLFLPWPFTRKMVQPPPYRGTDPEFQAMRRLSKDQEEQKKVKKLTAKMVQLTVERHPRLKQACGDNVKVSKFWLDILYPGHPPPQPRIGG